MNFVFKIKAEKLYEDEEGEKVKTLDLFYTVKMKKDKSIIRLQKEAEKKVIKNLMDKDIIVKELELIKISEVDNSTQGKRGRK